jgi:hypothetical protein
MRRNAESILFVCVCMFACLCVSASNANAQFLVLDYPQDDTLSIAPFVFHTGSTMVFDTAGNVGVMANLGQNIIQMVGSDKDSLGQGFWYQLRLRRPPLVPAYGDSLYQNYPNPFNPLTYVPFSISSYLHQHRKVHVVITLTSVLGIQVAKVVEGEYVTGYYAVLFDARRLASGTYIYKMTIDDFGLAIPTHSEFSRKMNFLR